MSPTPSLNWRLSPLSIAPRSAQSEKFNTHKFTNSKPLGRYMDNILRKQAGSGELTVVYGNYIRNMIVKKILDLITKIGKLLKK